MAAETEDPGDLQAFVKLMTENQASLRAFIVSLMPGSPDVGDVLQETNAALWLKRANFRIGSNFIAWAFRVARYEVHRQRDRNRRLGRIGFSEEMFHYLSEADEPDEAGEKLASALDDCLGKLTEKQRELVRERYTPGRSLEGYASRTGCSPGSLRISLLRIREVLKICVENRISGNAI